MSFIEICLRGFFGAGLASAGFAILFNIRDRSIWFAALTGALGGLIYNICVYYKINPVLANFYAVLVMASASQIFARIFDNTVSTYLACGLIPLVPGGDAYRMMVAFLKSDISQGLADGLEMVAIAVMLVLGILVISVLTHLLHYIKSQLGHVHLRRSAGTD